MVSGALPGNNTATPSADTPIVVTPAMAIFLKGRH